MNIRDLKYFVKVAELGHFGKAAQACFVSQPTLSGQIKKLEETLGIKLFERSNRKVMLTDFGRDVLVSAKKILNEVETINEIAERQKDPLSGRFKLGAFPTLASYIFPHLVTNLKREIPQLKLVLIEEKTDQLMERLKQGKIDAALLALPIDDDSLMTKKLFDDPFYLATNPEHELASKKQVSQDVLNQYQLLLLEEGHCLRDQALDVCQLHNIAEEQDFRATSIETLRQMVKAGTGITFMPKIAIHENEQGICYIPFKSPAPQRTIGLVWRKTTTRTPVIEKLIKIFE